MSTVFPTLAAPAYVRALPDAVDEALARLECSPSASFRDFFRRYAGPFSSEHTGFTLFDLVDQSRNIETETMTAREVHDFATRYLVLSDLVGNAVLTYDCETDAVFEVDFEGGDRELAEHRLAPTWTSFESFLTHFFGGEERRRTR